MTTGIKGKKIAEEMDYFVLYFTLQDYGTDKFTLQAFRKTIGYTKDKGSQGYKRFFHGSNLIEVLCDAIEYFYGSEVKEKELQGLKYNNAVEILEELKKLNKENSISEILNGYYFNITVYFDPREQKFFMIRNKINSINFEIRDTLNKGLFRFGKYFKKSTITTLQEMAKKATTKDISKDNLIKNNLEEGLYAFTKDEKTLKFNKKELSKFFDEIYPEYRDITNYLTERVWLTEKGNPNPKYEDKYNGFIYGIMNYIKSIFNYEAFQGTKKDL